MVSASMCLDRSTDVCDETCISVNAGPPGASAACPLCMMTGRTPLPATSHVLLLHPSLLGVPFSDICPSPAFQAPLWVIFTTQPGHIGLSASPPIPDNPQLWTSTQDFLRVLVSSSLSQRAFSWWPCLKSEPHLSIHPCIHPHYCCVSLCPSPLPSPLSVSSFWNINPKPARIIFSALHSVVSPTMWHVEVIQTRFVI